eukprot:scaffold132391_cov19-Tisochrysis_lutea.AAC.1
MDGGEVTFLRLVPCSGLLPALDMLSRCSPGCKVSSLEDQRHQQIPQRQMSCFPYPQGVNNFAVMSSNAMAISLVLFDEDDLAAGRSTHEIPLNPTFNRTGDVWHIALPDLSQDLLYGGCMCGT